MAVDYDPIKAHEYYERHKKLKGRHSTKKFNQSQKEQWAYAKQQLSEEHKSIKSGITNDAKNKRKEISERVSNAVSQLREKLKGMSKEQKALWREQIQGMISNLRSGAKEKKSNLTKETTSLRTKENGDYEKRKDQAYNRIRGGGN